MARKRSKHIPLTVLRHRRDRLGRIVAKRQGKRQAAGHVPLHVLERRLARLDRIVEARA